MGKKRRKGGAGGGNRVRALILSCGGMHLEGLGPGVTARG